MERWPPPPLSPTRQHLQIACANAVLQCVVDYAPFLEAKKNKLIGGLGKRVTSDSVRVEVKMCRF